jgi:hypothetical protein
MIATDYLDEVEAKEAGIQLGTALIWAAISKGISLQVDSTPSGYGEVGSSSHLQVLGSGTASLYWSMPFAGLFSLMAPVLTDWRPPADNVSLAMELYAGARLDVTPRARFIATVSSLEALAAPRPSHPAIRELVSEFNRQCVEQRMLASSEADYDDSEWESFQGRLGHLKNESIARSIRRLASEHLPDDPSAARTLQSAYELRSAMLHSDKFVELGANSLSDVSNVIRRLFARVTGWPLGESTAA